MPSIGDAIELLDSWYRPGWAQSWDSVGLIDGRTDSDLRVIHVAVDPATEVAKEAVTGGAQLLITHHPLWLGGVDRMSGPSGEVFSTLHDAGCALFVAHTNADVAAPGVSDALADALGLTDLRVMTVQDEALDHWLVHVPREFVDSMLDVLSAAGAGRIGTYDRCAFTVEGTGTFRPLAGADPFLGRIGEVESVMEARVEFVGLPSERAGIARALRAVHPYEEPSFAVTPTVTPSKRGLGRVGELPEGIPLRDFVTQVARLLPATAAGIRATGPADLAVRTVAVAGGSCLELNGDACRAGADVYVTSDAKHHRAQDARLPIIDVPHWAGEWPWTAALGRRLRDALPGVSVHVSRLVTDPWTMAAGDRVDRMP